MEFSLSMVLAIALYTTTTFGFPADLQATSTSLLANPQPTLPTWYQVGENNLGPIYSTTLSEKRSDALWYQVGENEHGPIYSSVRPTLAPRGDQQAADGTISEYATWLAEK